MADYFARATDNIFPEELLEKVAKEAVIFQNHEAEERNKRTAGGGYMHGKGGTFWRPLFNKEGEMTKPRFAIEVAIMLIYQSDFSNLKNKRVKGGEWWVQHRGATEDIGFHHDKDEGMASIKSTMKFPEVSTVTYLTDTGGPTLIFNQTTPDGNRDVPVIPHEAFLSYPRRNRHLLFRGNLQHGVVGELALEGEVHGLQLRSTDRRTTLLVNWWAEKPMPPNCYKIETQLVKQLGLYDKEGSAAMAKRFRYHVPKPAEWDAMLIPSRAEDRRRHVVPLAGHDILWYDLPHKVRRTLWQINFGEDQIHGNAARLDLAKGVHWVFSDPRIKLVAFVSPGPQEEAALPYLLRVAKELATTLKLVLADPATTQAAMEAFGLTRGDVPTAALHVTSPSDRKYRMPRGERGLTEGGVRRMLDLHAAGRLPVVGGNDADE